MDKRVSFRFYRVTRHPRAQWGFADALNAINGVPLKVDRERQLAEDFYVRAEQINAVRGTIAGELTRVQRSNFPSEIDGENRLPLQTRNPLGHSIVFRYLPGSSDLGIQYDPRVISPGRFVEYLAQMIEGAHFNLEPIVRADMWERFRQSPVRKLSIAIAQPSHIEAVDLGTAAAVTTSMRNMGEAYELPKLTIEMSMGHRRGALSEAVKGIVRHFRERAVGDQVHVSKMEAKIVNEDEKSEDINLLDDILVVKQKLELTDRDHDANYRIRIEALREAMNAWIE